MKRFGLAIASLALAAFVVGFTGSYSDGLKREGNRAEKDPLENKAAPKMEVTNWINADAKSMDWSKLKGKVVLLDFWGTWCGPCRAAIPHVQELYDKYKDDGLVVIGVHTTNGADKMAAYVKENNMTYPCVADVEGKTVKAFGIDSYPDYCIVDKNGILRVADLANADVDKAIEFYLKQ